MTDIYKYLQKRNKKDVVLFGKAYAYDKMGFVRFAEENWAKDDGNYVRAVASVASLLIDRPKLENEGDLPEQIYALTYAFGSSDGNDDLILRPLVKYFNNGKREGGRSEIEDEYYKKLEIYAKMANLRKQIESVDKKIKPILGEDVIARLKSYSGKDVILSLYKQKKIRTSEYMFKIYVRGNRPQDMAISFQGNTIHVVSDIGGVAYIKDPQSGEVIFENNVRGMKFSNQLEKYAHYYGLQKAIEILSDNIKEASQKQDDVYREKVKDPRTRKNTSKAKKVIETLKKTDSNSEVERV